jgi:hypothetical protein
MPRYTGLNEHAPLERDPAGADRPVGAGSVYHAQQPPPLRADGPNPDHVQPAHFPDTGPPANPGLSVKVDDLPSAIPPPPPPHDVPVVQADKAPPDPPAVTALRDLLQHHSADALEQLRGYDAVSRELLLSLLTVMARIGDGGLDQATPQETALLLEQVRQVEAVLRPRAALTLDKVCLCRTIKGFGDCEPWPADHVFQPGTVDRYGERMQVYVEVRNLTCRPCGPQYETSLAGVVDICDFVDPKHPAVHLDFPATVDRSQTARQDYFINFQFHLPQLPPGRYTLRVQVKDMLAPATADAAPRKASRSLDFVVGGPRSH